MVGIDYGLGQTNIDLKTGIRYGVISQNDILQQWADSSEPDYGDPHCPKCGQLAVEYSDNMHGDYPYDTQYSHNPCADYACETCCIYLDSSDVFPEEALGYTLDDGTYKAEDCLDSDVVVTHSPYYTLAAFCSPCVPGAGNLNSPDPRGVKTYCFGPDWFEDEKAPYPVYRVADDTLISNTKEEK